MEDVVDLTSPDDPPPRKRRRSSDHIDLADADEDRGMAAEAAEAAARRRIMEHARRVNQERGIAGPAPSAAAGQPQGTQPGSGGSAGGGSVEAMWPTITASATAAAASQPPAGPNRLLAELHAERMARLAQRQKQQEPPPPPPQQQQEEPRQGWQQLHADRTQQQLQPPPPQQQQQVQERPRSGQPHRAWQERLPPQASGGAAGDAQVTLLTWNVWFREDIHLEARMAAIGTVIQERQPTFVCLQEVTPLIYSLFSSSPWWPDYHCSPCPPGAPYFTLLLWSRTKLQGAGAYAEIPFENSCMGRDLKTVAGRVAGRSIRVATTHLESPTGRDTPFREARQAQLKQSAAVLDRAKEEDVLLAGDMNWSPDDGVPPLPGGWTDAFLHLHAGSSEQEGLTYDARANPMLKPGNRLRRRLDRIFCKLRRWRPASLEMVGRQALPGLQFEGRPVLPSDHFGLLLTLTPAP